ncbi:Matrin-type domain-containing protein [Aphelenchoides bicaudatus]|nr:Matrin-type domain-containing protein [Aphelenchoides bicaudatus]
MADYWVSNKKHYCEICKVWMADNKISRERHETGLAHKGRVQQRLREMSKKTKEKEAEQAHLHATLNAMGQAALASMRKAGNAVPQMQPGVYPGTSVSYQQDPPSTKHQEVQQIINAQVEKAKKRKPSGRPVAEGPTYAEKLDAKKDFESWKKKTQNRSNFDVRRLASSDNATSSSRPAFYSENGSAVTNEGPHVEEPYVEEPVIHSSGLGPWIPVEMPKPNLAELQKHDDAKKIKIDDLPVQDTGKTGDPLLDEDEQDLEIDFKEKVLPVDSKKSKPVMFRKVKKPKNIQDVKKEE